MCIEYILIVWFSLRRVVQGNDVSATFNVKRVLVGEINNTGTYLLTLSVKSSERSLLPLIVKERKRSNGGQFKFDISDNSYPGVGQQASISLQIINLKCKNIIFEKTTIIEKNNHFIEVGVVEDASTTGLCVLDNKFPDQYDHVAHSLHERLCESVTPVTLLAGVWVVEIIMLYAISVGLNKKGIQGKERTNEDLLDYLLHEK